MSTLTELEVEVASEIGSINATDDQTAIRRELNRGVRRILRQPPYVYLTSQTVTPGANADYTIATSILLITDLYVTAGSVDYPLEKTSLADIIRLRQASASSAGPARYYAQVGSNKLAFYPTPAAADTMTVYYVPVPTAMSTSSHDPSDATYGGIPVDYHDLIARYAMARLASFDDDASSAQGSRYWEEFNSGLAQMRRELNRHGGRRLPRARLSNRRIFPSDPSIVIR
ncbi:MAG: hypothetical protein NUW01_13340 [Gemmatimonadaceae bacterium]|nr:hypothetical protein [Gemmatimonadaceae bacterium]